jgi:hypothetical protein
MVYTARFVLWTVKLVRMNLPLPMERVRTGVCFEGHFLVRIDNGCGCIHIQRSHFFFVTGLMDNSSLSILFSFRQRAPTAKCPQKHCIQSNFQVTMMQMVTSTMYLAPFQARVARCWILSALVIFCPRHPNFKRTAKLVGLGAVAPNHVQVCFNPHAQGCSNAFYIGVVSVLYF